MFFDKEDDEQDFLNPKNSKLGALFGMDRAENQGGNESLTYTAPKQPKKKESTPPAKGGGPAVSFAVAVHAYKYVGNKYESQGKLGTAILANHATSEYSILMYVSQQQKITTAKITSAFIFTAQPNKYAQFYDDVRQSWSVLFESEQNLIDFAKHVCLAKALSTGPTPSSLLTQDLTAGDGGDLQTGDSVEVKYTGWLLTNNTFGQVFDTNASADKLFRFKIGAGKVIKGWDSGMTGMRKGGKRFLVVPPSLAYGSQGMSNRIPANATLLFEVEVVRVKLVGRESTPSPSPAQHPPTSQTPTADDKEEEEEGQTVKGRTKSITEQIAHSPPHDTSKAKLISRMAKMGKPMLPFSGAVPANPDSDEEHVPESPKPMTENPASEAAPVHKPMPRSAAQSVAQPQIQQQAVPQQVYPAMSQAQPHPAFLQNLPGAQQMAVYQPQSQQSFLQQQMMQQQGFQPQMYGGGVSNQPQAVPGMPQGQGDMMLLSETRQQNTEMRLSMSKVSDKMDQIMQKIDHINSQASSTSMLPNMETSVLLHNITRIIQENERLKKDVFDKSAKIESLNDKISGLLQQNQSYVEKSQVLMEQRNEGLLTSTNQVQSKVLALEQEKVALTQNLSEATSKISSLQMELMSIKKKEFELSQQLETGSRDTRKQGEELEKLRTQHADDESRIAELQRLLREEKHGRKSVDSSMSQLQEELADLRDTKQVLEKNLSERKKKAAEERRQMEDDMEDIKNNLEAEIQSLKNKLRKEKTSARAGSQEQISQLEEEINNDWQIKCDKLLAAAADKHARALQAVKEEKAELENALQEMEKKLAASRSSSSSSDQRLAQLQEEIEELTTWKEKYNSLRSNAATMKERYEERIQELEEEKSEADQLVQKLRVELKAGGGPTAEAGGGDSQSLLDEVKRIMNTVFKEMREVFDADESYTGKEILNVILNSIKSTTMSLMRRQKSEDEDQVEEEEEEEEDEDEEEEESEEEESEEEDEKDEDTSEKDNQDVKQSKESEAEIAEPKVESSVAVTEEAEAPSANTEDTEQKSEANVSETVKDSEPETAVETTQEAETVPEVPDKSTEESDEKADSGKEPRPAVQSVEIQGSSLKKSMSVEDVLDSVLDKEEEAEPVIQVKDQSGGSGTLRKADSLEDMLDTALDKLSKPETKAAPLVSTEPPPLMDASSEEEEEESKEETEKSRTKSIFNDGDDDDHVADTLGLTSQPVVNGDTKKPVSVEEDLKPKPPPPLFGDDDDDDDLDWLS